MIGTEILSDPKGRIRHVTYAHLGCRRLSVDEIPKVIEVRPYARVENIGDQNKKRKRSVISRSRDNLVYFESVFALLDPHVLLPENRRLVVITERLVGDHHVNLDRPKCGFQLRMRYSRTQGQHTDHNEHARRYFVIFHNSPL
jgi:hypothetical protein